MTINVELEIKEWAKDTEGVSSVDIVELKNAYRIAINIKGQRKREKIKSSFYLLEKALLKDAEKDIDWMIFSPEENLQKQVFMNAKRSNHKNEKSYQLGQNVAGETPAQVANYLLADLRIRFRGDNAGQLLCDSLTDSIICALKESAMAAIESNKKMQNESHTLH